MFQFLDVILFLTSDELQGNMFMYSVTDWQQDK